MEEGQQTLLKVEKKGTANEDIKKFDILAKQYRELKVKEEEIAESLKQVQTSADDLEKRILELMDKGLTKGKNFEAVWMVTRKTVGAPSPEELEKLQEEDPRLVKQTSGRIELVYAPDDILRAVPLVKELKNAGWFPKETRPGYKAVSLTEVKKVLTDRPDLNRRATEIYSLLDIKEHKKLKVIPTIFGE